MCAIELQWREDALLEIGNAISMECGQTLVLVWNNRTDNVAARSVWRTPTGAPMCCHHVNNHHPPRSDVSQ